MSYSVYRSMTVWIKENLFSKMEGSNRTFRTKLKLPTILKRNLFGFTYCILGAPLVAQLVESACSAGDPGSVPGLGRFPGEGNSNPLQYPCLENPMGWGAWQATVHGVAKSQTWLSDFTYRILAVYTIYCFLLIPKTSRNLFLIPRKTAEVVKILSEIRVNYILVV